MFVSAVYLQGVASFHPESVELDSIPDSDGKSRAKSRALENKLSSKTKTANFGIFPTHVLRVPGVAYHMLQNCGPSRDYGWGEFKKKPPPGFEKTREEFVRLSLMFVRQPCNEGETKPEGETKQADEGETKPADEAEAKPADEGETKPADEGETKPEVEAKPADEGVTKQADEEMPAAEKKEGHGADTQVTFPCLGYFGRLVFPSDKKPTSMTYIVTMKHTEASQMSAAVEQRSPTEQQSQRPLRKGKARQTAASISVLGDRNSDWLDIDLGQTICIDAFQHVWRPTPADAKGYTTPALWAEAFTKHQKYGMYFCPEEDDVKEKDDAEQKGIATVDWTKGTFGLKTQQTARKISCTAAMINHSSTHANCVSFYPAFEAYCPSSVVKVFQQEAREYFELGPGDYPDFFLTVVPAKPDLLRAVSWRVGV
jgi:ribosomal silencing factor RsfS